MSMFDITDEKKLIREINDKFEKQRKKSAGKRLFNPNLVTSAIKHYGMRMVSYCITTIHKWVGAQTFYIARVVDGKENSGIKTGITHNKVEARNIEGRWEKGYKYDDVLCLKYYESGLPVSLLEDVVLEKFKDRNILLDITAPGKGEIFPNEMEKEIIDFVESEYPKYLHIWGMRKR
tara:strand:+ start:82 stop:612 length:531 start_codon:yes stop_codon:yes gene_type:complete